MYRKKTYFFNPRVTFLFVLAAVVSVVFLFIIKDFLLSIFFGVLLSGLLYPFYSKLTQLFKGRKAPASGITVTLSLVLIIIPMLFFLGLVINEAISVSNQAREWFSDQGEIKELLNARIEKYQWLESLKPYQDDIINKAGQLTSKAGSLVAQGLAAGIKSTASFVFSLFIMLYAMFYFLMDGGNSVYRALSYTPLTESDSRRLLAIFKSVTRATIKGKIIIGILQAGLAALAMALAGIKGMFFWFAVMCVLSVIPTIGTTLVWIPAVIYLALTGHPGKAAAVGIWCALVVGSVDNILTPRLIGKDTKMPDLLVLLATLGGLMVFGASGILVGPVLGALFLSAWQMWSAAIYESREGIREKTSSALCLNPEGNKKADRESISQNVNPHDYEDPPEVFPS
ncbi:MAG: AI-2E family transporter [Kiritimatiellia bacterium]